MSLLKCFRVMDGDEHFYAAKSESDALKIHIETWGPTREETIIDLYPDSMPIVTDDKTLIASKWVEVMGRGLICSTALLTK